MIILNGGSCVVDDNGNPPPEEAGGYVQRLIGDIQTDRDIGRLRGEMTSDYLKERFAKYAEAAKSDKTMTALPDEWLTRALDYPLKFVKLEDCWGRYARLTLAAQRLKPAAHDPA